MKHARKDYDAIQDTSGRIPIDEPVFLLRGQDMLSPQTIRFWIKEYMANGGDTHNANKLEEHVQKIEEWQRTKKGAYPTIPPGVMDDDPCGYMTIVMSDNKVMSIESYPEKPSPQDVAQQIASVQEHVTAHLFLETFEATPQIKRLFSYLG